ncbi:hypothetical protein STEG23_006509 [Scotinomys teguina]
MMERDVVVTRALSDKVSLFPRQGLCNSPGCPRNPLVDFTKLNGIFKWARDHRPHHKYSETDADPHNAHQGFFFPHIRWLLVHKHPDVSEKGRKLHITDLLADPVVQFQRKTAALRTESWMCRLSWFLDPGGWSKTAMVGLYFIFPGICTLSLDCSLKIREPEVPAPWFLDPGGWSKTAAVRLYFIFPGIYPVPYPAPGGGMVFFLIGTITSAWCSYTLSSLHRCPGTSGERLWNSYFLASILRSTIALNSAAHMYGKQPYNNPLVDSRGIGEGFHNYHHTFPFDDSVSEFGLNFNPATWLMDFMCFLGLATDPKRATKAKTGDGSA